jgi:hypothetical protein
VHGAGDPPEGQLPAGSQGCHSGRHGHSAWGQRLWQPGRHCLQHELELKGTERGPEAGGGRLAPPSPNILPPRPLDLLARLRPGARAQTPARLTWLPPKGSWKVRFAPKASPRIATRELTPGSCAQGPSRAAQRLCTRAEMSGPRPLPGRTHRSTWDLVPSPEDVDTWVI